MAGYWDERMALMSVGSGHGQCEVCCIGSYLREAKFDSRCLLHCCDYFVSTIDPCTEHRINLHSSLFFLTSIMFSSVVIQS